MKRTLLLFAMLLSFGALVAQNYVSTEPQDKNAILEEFTGVSCPNCPAGHQVAAAILAANPGRAFVIAHHPANSSYTTPYPGDPDFRRSYLNVFYSTPYCGSSRFMPSAFVNRRQWGGERILSRADWTPNCNTIMAEPSPANMGLSTNYDFVTQELSIIVEIYYTDDMTDVNHIYVMLAENDLVSQQSGGSSAYTHKHTFRESFVAQWGDEITEPTTQGSLVTLNYTFDVTGTGYLMGNCDVLAFIENQANGEIITGVGVQVGESTAIAPMAEFSVDDNFVGVGGQATFTDESTGGPTEWEWTFEGGDPASSTLQSPPAITYNTAGQYGVTLTVTNAAGSNTMNMTNFMDVGYAPEAAFEANNTMILEGEGVMFTDNSTNDPTSWEWYFEGGIPETFSGQTPPEIIYNAAGMYTVNLTAMNEYGESILSEEDFIHVGGLGIIEASAKKAFNLYPNPSNGKLFIESRGAEAIEEISVRNASGQRVLEHTPSTDILQTLDLTDLETGLYFVEIKTETSVYLEKVLVK